LVAHRNGDENKARSHVVALFRRQNASPRPQNVKMCSSGWWKVKQNSGKVVPPREDRSEAFQ
jgi:hypothetical protein